MFNMPIDNLRHLRKTSTKVNSLLKCVLGVWYYIAGHNLWEPNSNCKLTDELPKLVAQKDNVLLILKTFIKVLIKNPKMCFFVNEYTVSAVCEWHNIVLFTTKS